MIVFSAIMPHPPMSIPGVGTNEDLNVLKKTITALEKLRSELEIADPDTILIISPHAHIEKYSFVINSASELKGNFAKFGNDEIHSYKNNIKIADNLNFACLMNELPSQLRDDFLDHGTLVPLYYLTKNIKPSVVSLSFSFMDYATHYRYGEVIQKIIDDPKNGRVAVIASGDLSHRLTPNAPAGFSKFAQEFDHSILRFLGSGDLVSIMGLEKEVAKEAAECGIRSIIILLGILHGKPYKFNLLSYEGPFGVGHLTARLL